MNALACCTGKSLDNGGVMGYREANGRGIYFGLKHLMNIDSFVQKVGLEKGLLGKKIIITGLGNIGYWAVKLL